MSDIQQANFHVYCGPEMSCEIYIFVEPDCVSGLQAGNREIWKFLLSLIAIELAESS